MHKWNVAEPCRKLEHVHSIKFNLSHHILQCIGPGSHEDVHIFHLALAITLYAPSRKGFGNTDSATSVQWTKEKQSMEKKLIKRDETCHLQIWHIINGDFWMPLVFENYWNLALALLSPCNTRLPSSCCPTWRMAWVREFHSHHCATGVMSCC